MSISRTRSKSGGGLEPGPSANRVKRMVPLTLAVNAAQLARSVVGLPYLWGGKGWDHAACSYASPSQIGTGYTFWDPRLKDLGIGKGLDCSGLVMWSFNLAANATRCGMDNVVFSEGAAGQYENNTIVITEHSLQPGDLLFFKNLRRVGIDHVAMYVGGPKEVNVIMAQDSEHGIVYARKDYLVTLPAFLNGGGFRRVASAIPMHKLTPTDKGRQHEVCAHCTGAPRAVGR